LTGVNAEIGARRDAAGDPRIQHRTTAKAIADILFAGYRISPASIVRVLTERNRMARSDSAIDVAR
jgi:hypothetical protein